MKRIIAITKEVKTGEGRVAVTPQGVADLVRRGHAVRIEAGAGEKAGFPDVDYHTEGAIITADAQTTVVGAHIWCKIKEPLPSEFPLVVGMEKGIIFAYLHLASNLPLTSRILNHHVSAIAFETITDEDGTLPLLAPMSAIAGREAITHAAMMLHTKWGGCGKVFAAVPGVLPLRVVIVGGGVVGEYAARSAIGLGAYVTVFERNAKRVGDLRGVLEHAFPWCQDRFSVLLFEGPDKHEFAAQVANADVLIGAAANSGFAAPHVVPRALILTMRQGSVLVDVSIDQGGCFEGSVPTSHDAPYYQDGNVVRSAVANMPGQVPQSATAVLAPAILPYLVALADNGLDALRKDAGFRKGLVTYQGFITNQGVAKAANLPTMNTERILGIEYT